MRFIERKGEKRSHSKGRNEPNKHFYERAVQRKINNQAKNEMIKNEMKERERELCTFTPNIGEMSRQIVNVIKFKKKLKFLILGILINC